MDPFSQYGCNYNVTIFYCLFSSVVQECPYITNIDKTGKGIVRRFVFHDLYWIFNNILSHHALPYMPYTHQHLLSVTFPSLKSAMSRKIFADRSKVPPLTVCILCGPSLDCLINCCLFLCGVIPSHLHGFYISCTYFNRKRKVRKGKWPGPRRGGIYSENVQNGGVTRDRVKVLREDEEVKRLERLERRVSKRGSMKRHY